MCGPGLLLLSACGARTGFRSSFPVNQPKSVAQALSRVTPAELESLVAPRPRVFLVTASPAGLISFDLTQRKVLWRVDGPVTSRVVASPKGVFHLAEGHTLVGRRHATGEVLWRHRVHQRGRLIGICAAGERVYYAVRAAGTATQGEDGAKAYLVALEATTGKRDWHLASQGTIGAPSAVGQLLIVPLRNQSIALVDGSDGVELARLRSREEALLWTRVTTRGIFFGGAKGIYRLDERATTERGGRSYLAPAVPDFGSARPQLGLNAYHASARYSAFDRTRALWHVAEGSPTRLLDDTVFVQYFRYVFALGLGDRAKQSSGSPVSQPAADDGSAASDTAPMADHGLPLRWAQSLARRQDVVGSTHTGGALVLVGSRGDVLVLDPHTGATVSHDRLGVPVVGAGIDAEGFVPPPSSTATAPDMVNELSRIIRDPDRRLDPAKYFSADHLGEIPGMPATKALVALLGDERLIDDLQPRIAEAVVTRRDLAAVPLYAAALTTRYSYVHNTRPRSLYVFARALAALKTPQAVPILLPHLADHETELSALPEILKALRAAADVSAVKPVSEFLLTYRCDPEFANAPESLILAARLLIDLGGAAERKLVNFVANDGYTLVHLRMHLLSELLVAADATTPAAPAAEVAPAETTPPVRKGAK